MTAKLCRMPSTGRVGSDAIRLLPSPVLVAHTQRRSWRIAGHCPIHGHQPCTPWTGQRSPWPLCRPHQDDSKGVVHCQAAVPQVRPCYPAGSAEHWSHEARDARGRAKILYYAREEQLLRGGERQARHRAENKILPAEVDRLAVERHPGREHLHDDNNPLQVDEGLVKEVRQRPVLRLNRGGENDEPDDGRYEEWRCEAQ